MTAKKTHMLWTSRLKRPTDFTRPISTSFHDPPGKIARHSPLNPVPKRGLNNYLYYLGGSWKGYNIPQDPV